MTDRVPGAPGQYTMTVSASEVQKMLTGEAVSVTLVRDDQPLVEGTPYNKQQGSFLRFSVFLATTTPLLYSDH